MLGLTEQVSRLLYTAHVGRMAYFELKSILFVGQITKEKQNFQRVVVSREEALSMFQENKFKVEIISGLPAEATISLYRSGSIAHLVLGTQTSLGTSPKAMHKSPNTLHEIVIC